MVDVNIHNARRWFPEIEKSIREAAFISIDFEFLGLPSSSSGKVSLFDTPPERYVKMREAVQRFPPCQMGLACFSEDPNVEGYTVEVYCIGLFKRISTRVFSFSLSAMNFLAKHKFDFNKFISEGITYGNRSEIAAIRKEILEGVLDYDIFTDGLDHKIQMLKLRILNESVESGSEDSILGSERLRLRQPLILELFRRDFDEQSDVVLVGNENETLWDRPLSGIEAATVVYELCDEYPHLDIQVDHTRTFLYVAERPLMVKHIVDKKRQKTLLKNLLSEVCGISQVMQLICERKVPLVGHNSLLDLMYCYHCFEDELPDNYEEFKRVLHDTYPVIIDTKVIASAVHERLAGVQDLSLQTLGNFFDSPSCGSILPFPSPVINGGQHSAGVFDDGEHYHNAAFDALITGEIFVKLANLFAYTKCSETILMQSSWPARKLIFVLKATVANRIPIPLIDAQHCYITGPDPEGERPSLIVVRKRRTADWFYEVVGEGRLTAITDWLIDRVLSWPLVTDSELDRMREDLCRVLGSYRVDVRRDETGKLYHVATNTASTYARVCSFFTSHENFHLFDDNADESFDLRMMTAQKDKEKKKLHPPKSVGLFGPFVTISGLVLCAVIATKHARSWFN